MILNINEAHFNNDIQAHDEIKLVVVSRYTPIMCLTTFMRVD